MSGFDFLTLEDAYQNRPPIKYAVQGIIEMPSVNILYGNPATMKSMIEADKVHCILNGIPWLQNDQGIPSIPTTKTGVLWVDFDNGKRRTLDRISAVGRHYGTPVDAPLRIVSCAAEGLNMRDPESVLRLQDTISQDIGYVVVDNLGLVSGGADENSTQMVAVMLAFRGLAERTGVAFSIIHHERKGSARYDDRAGDKIRGSTSIESALDRAFRVVRQEGKDFITISSVKERDQGIRPMSAKFHFIQDDNDQLVEAWFTGEAADNLEYKIQKSILSFLAKSHHNQKEIINHVKEVLNEFKVGRPIIVRSLDHLVKSNKLSTFKPGPNNSILYGKRTNEQPALGKFTDIVHYNQEIEPTAGG